MFPYIRDNFLGDVLLGVIFKGLSSIDAFIGTNKVSFELSNYLYSLIWTVPLFIIDYFDDYLSILITLHVD